MKKTKALVKKAKELCPLCRCGLVLKTAPDGRPLWECGKCNYAETRGKGTATAVLYTCTL